jgi:hypothetical protein
VDICGTIVFCATITKERNELTHKTRRDTSHEIDQKKGSQIPPHDQPYVYNLFVSLISVGAEETEHQVKHEKAIDYKLQSIPPIIADQRLWYIKFYKCEPVR